MKKRNIVFLVIIGVLTFTAFTYKLSSEKNKIIQGTMIQSLSLFHFKNVNIDNDFSEKVFNEYIKRLDYNKRFFLQSDIDEFAKFKYKIDNEIDDENLDFYELTKDRYIKRITEVKEYYTEALEKSFNFKKDETLEPDPEKRIYAKNKKELKNNWRLLLKYSVMEKLANKLQAQEDAEERKDTSVTIKSFEELEKEAREETKKTFDDWYHRIQKTNDRDLSSIYFNSMAALYDPHTQYFPPEDKENFDISMSGKLEGIGATLSQPNAYIKVERIVPGSACWKQGELEVGDLILKVAQGEDEPVNVVDMRLDDAIKMIRGKKGTEVRLTVKKADGTIKVIPIIRDIVILDETYAKSTVILDSISGQKIGYIHLPQFYADFGNINGRRCSDDVEKEIRHLKNEKVEGIIFDLRNNGGGSLQDVVQIVGMFIKSGPVVQVKQRNSQTKELTDYDPDILYDGKLLIMVNEHSASASEIMAAAIQDYDRGVIVGGKTTFGKGTVQQFLPFDRFVEGHDSIKPLGSLKLTIQKFYRVNGGSTQLKGVESDIVFPTTFGEIDYGEKDMDYAIEWDEINKAEYIKVKKSYNIDDLRKNSEQRTSNDTVFQKITEYAKYLKDSQDESEISLNINKYREIQKEKGERSKAFKKALKRKNNLMFKITKSDSSRVYSDSINSIKYDAWKKELSKDVYLEESYRIISEMK